MSENKFRIFDENGRVMKGHMNDGIINEDIPRVSPELIESIAKYGAAKIAELQGYGGVMNKRIAPIKSGFQMAGPAFTAWGRPGSMLFQAAACYMAKPGDVLVFGGGSQDAFISFGDGIGGAVQRRGVAGLVMDAPTHDLLPLRELNFPMFCRGFATYAGGASAGGGAINIPVACGDVVVNPGDIIIGDDDGVVVVPWQDAERIAAVAEAQYPIDAERRRKAKEGATLIELNNMQPAIDKWVNFQRCVTGR